MKPVSKAGVRQFWEEHPCGAADASAPPGTAGFFSEVETERFAGDHFMTEIAEFSQWSGREVLEVGCGLGTDLVQFARGGARVHAVDLTHAGVRMTLARLSHELLPGSVAVGDAEHLPFRDDSFDLVYCWGVLHHTPDPTAAVREILRTCKPGGRVIAMVYNRRSLFAFQVWVVFGLLRGRPFRRLSRLISDHVESFGTRAYTVSEAKQLFSGLADARITPIVTRYDTRIGRRAYLPRRLRSMIPAGLGWFLVMKGTKN